MPSSSFSDKCNTPASVLQSVALITGQRDRDLLGQTLVRTLAELIHSHRITMYRILHGDKGATAILVAESCTNSADTSGFPDDKVAIVSRKDFNSVFESQKEYVQAIGENTYLSVYPIVCQNGIVGLLEMVSTAHSEMDMHLILAFLKVYSNYLSVLDESETDTLTGLLNRRTFDNNIEKIIAEHSVSDKAQVGAEHPARRTDENESRTGWRS